MFISLKFLLINPMICLVKQENSDILFQYALEKRFFFDYQSNQLATLSPTVLPDQGVPEEIKHCYVPTPLRDDI